MRRFVPALILLSSLGSVSLGCLPWLDETSSETIVRAGISELVVRLDRGSVSVQEHLGPDVEVEVRRSAGAPSREAARAALEALVVEFKGEEDSEAFVVTSRVATAGAFRPWEDLALTLRIAVPTGTAVDVHTADGGIELRGLTGAVRATTASGRIFASDLRSLSGPQNEPIQLRTADGNIQGESLEGRIHAETGDGRIRLLGRLQQVTAVSAGGRIEVAVEGGGASGDSEWFLRTASGSVRLRLPRGANARVSAVGAVTSEDDSDLREWQREGPIALATLGDGRGPRINLRTGDGSIRLRVGGRN